MSMSRRKLINPILSVIPVSNKLRQTRDENLRNLALADKEQVERYWQEQGEVDYDRLNSMFYHMLNLPETEDFTEDFKKDEIHTIFRKDDGKGPTPHRNFVDVDIMRCSPTAFRVSLLRDMLKHKKVTISLRNVTYWMDFVYADREIIHSAL